MSLFLYPGNKVRIIISKNREIFDGWIFILIDVETSHTITLSYQQVHPANGYYLFLIFAFVITK